METALVPVRRSIATQVSLSPFGAMIAELEARASQTGHTHFGRVTWSALPIRHLLADAAALIVDAVAARGEERLGTHSEAEKLAEATDARLNIGLLLLYSTPELAADAFEVQVIGALKRAVAIGYRGGMTLSDLAWRALMRGATGVAVHELRSQTSSEAAGELASFWSRPAYVFLAGCVKRGREYAQEMSDRVSELKHTNATALSGIWVLQQPEMAAEVVNWLDGEPSAVSRLQEALKLSAELDDYEAQLVLGRSVLKAEMPLRGNEMCVDEHGMFMPWLHTSVLKVARGDAKITPGPLSPEQAMEAQERLRELDQEAVIEQVMSVIRDRARRVDPSLLVRGIQLVRAHLCEHIARLVKSEHAPNLAEHFIDPYLGDANVVVLTHAAALEYLDPFNEDDVREPLPEELMNAIEAALDWGSFDPEELQLLIEGGSLPADVVLRHMKELSKPARKRAVATLLDYHPEMVNTLLASGLVEWSQSLVDHSLMHLSPEYLERVLCEALVQETTFEMALPKYVGIMLLLPTERLRRIWEDPTYHDPLVGFMEAFLFDSGATDISDVHEKALAERVPVAFHAYGLQAYVKFRAAIYAEEPLMPKAERKMPRWEKTASSQKTSWSLVVRMRKVFGKQLASMIAAQSEEACFRDLVQDEPDQDRRMRAFLANRSRFYGP